MIVAGLFVRSLSQAEHIFLGFDPDRVLSVMITPRQIGFDDARTENFIGEDRLPTSQGRHCPSRHKTRECFCQEGSRAFLGDFGLVFVPERQRLTFDGETVGARDFIPLWGEEGNRLDHVKPDFDVYMLGKVLWCMVSGSSVLRRERFMKPDNDVTKLFPYDPHTYMINDILRHCVVEEQKDCFSSADDLLLVVDTYLEVIKQRGQLLNDGIPRPCHVCGLGHYARQAHDKNDPVYQLRIRNSGGANDISTFHTELFTCDKCGHIEFFRTTPR